MKSCLIITDVQNDFCPGGALAVKGGDRIIPAINAISSRFDLVVATQDWHPTGHISFARTHGREPYEIIRIDGQEQVLWPEHCVPGTFGSEFHRDLDLRDVDLIVRKGSNPQIDSYSTFLENDRKTETGLHYYLQGLEVKDLYLCGLATDYCIYSSALDAVRMGFSVAVVLDACRGVDVPAGSVLRAVTAMKNNGIRIVDHEVLSG